MGDYKMIEREDSDQENRKWKIRKLPVVCEIAASFLQLRLSAYQGHCAAEDAPGG